MRSSIHGTFATLMLLIPVGAIPALAIFGIPQFAPVVASPLREGHERDREHRVGESARPPADDLFHEDADFPAQDDETAPLAFGRRGDSVPAPNRNTARNSSRTSEFAGPSSRLPSWADDTEVDDRRPPVSRREDSQNSKLDRFAQIADDTPPRGNAEPSPFRQASAERGLGGSQGYQRHRNDPSSQVSSATRDESPREALSWQGALHRLNELEIRNFRLEPSRQANQFIFICMYTPNDSPRVSHRFEAESEEPLKAVEKVLAQIDEWKQQRP